MNTTSSSGESDVPAEKNPSCPATATSKRNSCSSSQERPSRHSGEGEVVPATVVGGPATGEGEPDSPPMLPAYGLLSRAASSVLSEGVASTSRSNTSMVVIQKIEDDFESDYRYSGERQRATARSLLDRSYSDGHRVVIDRNFRDDRGDESFEEENRLERAGTAVSEQERKEIVR